MPPAQKKASRKDTASVWKKKPKAWRHSVTSPPKRQAVPRANTLSVDGLSLDLDLKTCSVDGEEVKLTKKEFELLAFLIANKGKICSRDQILANVWSDEVIVLDRTIDVNITRIRQKIGQYGSCIITRAGFGYGFGN